jgi:cytidylate kinase
MSTCRQCKRIITIDGPAGSGKSTLARSLSQRLDLPYLDTGAMFRAVALLLGEEAWEWPEHRIREALDPVHFSLSGSGGETKLLMNQETVGEAIRNERIGRWASNLAKLPPVRAKLKEHQQAIGERMALVAEGRDMGTVVFPEAEHKFFLQATARERARRRWLQLRDAGEPSDLEAICRDIESRDRQDESRQEAPLKPAPDALCIDTTPLSAEEVLQLMLDNIQARAG